MLMIAMTGVLLLMTDMRTQLLHLVPELLLVRRLGLVTTTRGLLGIIRLRLSIDPVL